MFGLDGSPGGEVADGAEQVGSGVELTPAGCQGLLLG